jgi:FG-GAP-like repeat
MRRFMVLGTVALLMTALLVALVGGTGSAGQAAEPRFAPPKNYDNPGRGTPQNLVKGDFDEDGVVDLVMAVADSPNDVSLFEGKRDGTFVQPPKQFDVARSAVFVIKSDLNGDSHLDLAVSDIGNSPTAPGAVVVLLGKGDGTFEKARSFPSGGKQPTGLAAPDVDGDGDKDLAVANAIPGVGNGAFRNVTILKNNGEGVFKTGQSVATGRGPTGGPLYLAKGDFDQDGDPDLVATVPGSDAVAFLENKSGRYELAQSVKVGQDPQLIIAGYLNGDRKLDFANTNAESNDVSVRLGKGDGTFRKTGEFPSGGVGPTSLRAPDLNNDGKKDPAVTNIGEGPGGGGNVGVLPGRGDGTFRRPVTFHAGDGPAGIVGGNFDGDGRVDLAVANAFSNNLSVLINTTPR